MKATKNKKKISPRRARKEFDARFEKHSSEILVLNLSHVYGAINEGGMCYPRARFIACADLPSGEVREENGSLCWICKSGHWLGGFPPFSGRLKPLTIYKARVRREKPKEDGTQSNAYLVERLSPCRKPTKEMAELRDRLRRPVVIEDELGSFTLNRELSQFEGEIDWLGNECSIMLQADEEYGDCADNALAALHNICADVVGWDSRLRAFAAEELTDSANDWRGDEETEEITPESFAQRITLAFIDIDEEGGIAVFFDDDGMFASHSIHIEGNADGQLESADLWG